MQEVLSTGFANFFIIFSDANWFVTRSEERSECKIGLTGPRQQLANRVVVGADIFWTILEFFFFQKAPVFRQKLQLSQIVFEKRLNSSVRAIIAKIVEQITVGWERL